MDNLVKDTDINLYEWIYKNANNMNHDDLYYILLDWKDKHQDVRKEVEKKHDTYTVNWYDEKENSGHEMLFTSQKYNNPYISALTFFQEIKTKEYGNISCGKLWHNANPFGTGMIRGSTLIGSFERNKK